VQDDTELTTAYLDDYVSRTTDTKRQLAVADCHVIYPAPWSRDHVVHETDQILIDVSDDVALPVTHEVQKHPSRDDLDDDVTVADADDMTSECDESEMSSWDDLVDHIM